MKATSSESETGPQSTKIEDPARGTGQVPHQGVLAVCAIGNSPSRHGSSRSLAGTVESLEETVAWADVARADVARAELTELL